MSHHAFPKQYHGCIGSGGDYGEQGHWIDSEYNTPEQMNGVRREYHQIKKRLAGYKARLLEATEIMDTITALQKSELRFDAVNALKQLADIVTERALKCDGRMGKVADYLGGEVMASHRDANLIEQHFGSKGFHDMERLIHAVKHGVPVDVIEGGNLDAALQYGNHSSTLQHGDLLLERLIEDVASGRVLPLHRSVAHAIRGLRISPLAVVDERQKSRVILDLTVGAGVNKDTDFDKAPVCDLGDVIFRFIAQTCARREQVGADVPIYISKMDVKDAFRRVHIEWEKAPIFSYVVGEYIVIDFRLAFGWRSSPGWWGLMAAAILHSHRNTDVNTAVVLPDARLIAKDVKVLVPAEGLSATCAPYGVGVIPKLKGNPEAEFYAEMYVDDMLNLEACARGNESRLLTATFSAISDHLRMFGSSNKNPVPILSQKKLTNWAVCQEVLGFDIDTQRMRIKLPERKRLEMLQLLQKWPSTRMTATAKEMWSLTGKLRYVAKVVRPGRFFVWRLLLMVGLEGQKENGDTQLAAVPKGTVVLLGQEFHADLEWWKWALCEQYLVDGVSLYSPFFNHTQWVPERHWFSDATLSAVGGFCAETGVWWRYDLTAEEKSRSVVGGRCAMHNAISINLLELLAMVMTAYMMVVKKSDHSNIVGAPVVMLGDNVSAVTWVNKCGGTRDPRAAFLMRYLGRIEMRAGWCFEAAHIPGVENVLADGISRWPRETINSRLSSLYPCVNWQEANLGKSGGTMCSGVLQAYCRRSEWLRRLTPLMKLPGGCGRSGD